MTKKEYLKAYYQKNKAQILESNKKWRDENKDKMKTYKDDWREQNIDKVKHKEKLRYEANKERIKIERKEYFKAYMKEYRQKKKSDPLYMLNKLIANSIRQALKNKGYTKNIRTHKILGCTIQQFKEHIEAQFQPWMNWENRGLYNGTENYGWDIDHIIPLKTAITIEDVIRLNHYTNLQPLCSYYNRDVKKGKV